MSAQATITLIKNFCSPVIHPITGELITSYNIGKIPRNKRNMDIRIWEGMRKLKTGSKFNKSMFVLHHKEIKWIPADRAVTYSNTVVSYRQKKSDPNHVRITAGGNLINYPGELTTKAADLTNYKILWNIIFITINSKHMCVDIKKFYLCTLLERLKDMRISLSAFQEHIIKQYNLRGKSINGYVYIEIR